MLYRAGLMDLRETRFFSLIGTLCFFIAITGFTFSANAAEDFGKINNIIIKGNQRVPQREVMANVHSRPEQFYNEKTVASDARRIRMMTEIISVDWEVTVANNDPSLLNVTFNVVEAPVIEELLIVGNDEIDTEDIIEELQFSQGDFIDTYLVREGITDIKKYYIKECYAFVQVELDEKRFAEDRAVVYNVVEGPLCRIKKFTFEGNYSISDFRLNKAIDSNSYFPIFKSGRIEEPQIQNDIYKVNQHYISKGFLDAEVSLKRIYNDDKTRVIMHYIIDEGPLYYITSIKFNGNEQFSTEELIAELGKFAPGKVLEEDDKVMAEKKIRSFYDSKGYIYARVGITYRYTDDPGQVELDFNITEMGKYFLRDIIITGNTVTKDKVIRRDFDRHGFTPGEIYDQHAVGRAERRLKGSQYFSEVSVEPIGSGENERDALVTVAETSTGQFAFGVAVDTNSGVMGQFSVVQRNFDITNRPKSLYELFTGQSFLGGGQSLRLSIEPGTEIFRGNLQFHEPYLFDQPNYLDVNLYIFRRWRESYLERKGGGSIGLGRRFKNLWAIDGSVRFENITISDLDDEQVLDPDSLVDEDGNPTVDVDGDGDIDRYDKYNTVVTAPIEAQEVEGDNFLTSVTFGVGRDTTDRMFRPSEGYKTRFSWEQVGAFGGDFTFAKVSASAKFYNWLHEDLAERRTILKTKIQGGHIIGDAPLFEKYYAGGAGSLRGFEFRGVSPRSATEGNDDPVGSDSIFLVSTELVHPLYEKTLYGKVFCDSGVVDEGRYRVVVGFGLELVIPQLFQMVPMQFNFGFPLLEDDEDENEVFSFTFGMNF